MTMEKKAAPIIEFDILCYYKKGTKHHRPPHKARAPFVYSAWSDSSAPASALDFLKDQRITRLHQDVVVSMSP